MHIALTATGAQCYEFPDGYLPSNVRITLGSPNEPMRTLLEIDILNFRGCTMISSYCLEILSIHSNIFCQAHGWNTPACSLITYLQDFRDPSHRCLLYDLVPESASKLIEIGKIT